MTMSATALADTQAAQRVLLDAVEIDRHTRQVLQRTFSVQQLATITEAVDTVVASVLDEDQMEGIALSVSTANGHFATSVILHRTAGEWAILEAGRVDTQYRHTQIRVSVPATHFRSVETRDRFQTWVETTSRKLLLEEGGIAY